jgi:deazaflavin-dependent oxidoreductase (nitroreductase family)
MRRSLFVAGAVAAGLYGGALWWRRNPRVGTRFTNEVVDPWLVRQGLVDRSEGELALLEHVGRHSGTVRRTPVHPERIQDGIRIVVPLGEQSEWARNVLAAGHCRMQVGAQVLELDEPMLVEPSELGDLPAPVRALYQWLGFRYLLLHRFSESTGALDGTVADDEPRTDGVEATSAQTIPSGS